MGWGGGVGGGGGGGGGRKLPLYVAGIFSFLKKKVGCCTVTSFNKKARQIKY